VELLVVIAVIAILVGLLLPAVQAARESARRASCQNNLKQIGLALHNYESSFRMLPISVDPWGTDIPGASGKGWIVGVLPALEQQALYDQLSPGFTGSFFAAQGMQLVAIRPFVQTQLEVLRCPSDGSSRVLSSEQFQWPGIPVALTNYKGVMGDPQLGGGASIHIGTLPDCHAKGGCNGLFYRQTYREPQGFSDVKDGLSNTLMVGEDVASENAHSAAFYANGDYASCHAPLNYFPGTPLDWPNVMSFRSRHPGGAQFCLADGSVRFVAKTVEHSVYRALSTRSGRESVTIPP
jgi:prepilin-type processing-associated H-X9-DG protein